LQEVNVDPLTFMVWQQENAMVMEALAMDFAEDCFVNNECETCSPAVFSNLHSRRGRREEPLENKNCFTTCCYGARSTCRWSRRRMLATGTYSSQDSPGEEGWT
jgi:hypothetical protein